MFNPRFVAKLYPDGEAPEFITHVDAADKGVSQVEPLTSFRQLLRLNLASNQLTEFGGLAASTTLKQLLLSGNSMTKLPSLDIPELQVLSPHQHLHCSTCGSTPRTCRLVPKHAATFAYKDKRRHKYV